LFIRLQATNLQLVHGDVMRLELQQLVQQVTAAASHAAQQQGDSADGNGQLQQPAPPHQGAAAAGVPASDSSSSSSSSVSKRRRVKVVANLPYNITKDFLVAMLPQGELISELSIMIQVGSGGGVGGLAKGDHARQQT
jgi:16S rRNA A1518/A1519 N6-dimethyltransferase RsmA/KsgA/DIM1 with predicted DNA glycosylase/AP lyase activity